MSYEDSLSDIKKELSEWPSPKNLEELRKEYKTLVQEFLNTPLGERWCHCIGHEAGLESFANYFMHHRKEFTEEDEHEFFFTLDKICLLQDVLHGKADKHGLIVKYPDGWLDEINNEQPTPQRNEQSQASNSEEVGVASCDAIVPEKCILAVDKVLTQQFSMGGSVVLNSRSQLIKAAEQIDRNRSIEVAVLMAIGQEVGAVLPSINCRDFVRALIGLGVIPYTDEKAIDKMADGMSKKINGYTQKSKKHKGLGQYQNHRYWEQKDQKIGNRLFEAFKTQG